MDFYGLFIEKHVLPNVTKPRNDERYAAFITNHPC